MRAFGNHTDGSDALLVLAFDNRHHFAGEGLVSDERGIALGDIHVCFAQNHLGIVDHRTKKRPVAVHLLQQGMGSIGTMGVIGDKLIDRRPQAIPAR